MTKRFNNYEELANAHNDLLNTCEELMNIIQNLVPTCQKLISIYEKINLMDEANYYDDAEVDYDSGEQNIPDYINDRENYINYLLWKFDSSLIDALYAYARADDMSLYDYVNKIIDEKGEAHIDYFLEQKASIREQDAKKMPKYEVGIFKQYEAIARKNTILDPVKGAKYLKNRKKLARTRKLAEQFEGRVRVMY